MVVFIKGACFCCQLCPPNCWKRKQKVILFLYFSQQSCGGNKVCFVKKQIKESSLIVNNLGKFFC